MNIKACLVSQTVEYFAFFKPEDLRELADRVEHKLKTGILGDSLTVETICLENGDPKQRRQTVVLRIVAEQ